MENQTLFDLNAAIENWRMELGAQPDFSADDRHELETHLRDSVVELKLRGLSEEESFWLASRRIGQPQKLAEEFVKADPSQVWRERILLIALALLVIRLWNSIISVVFAALSANPAFFLPRNLESQLPKSVAWVAVYWPLWLRNFRIPTEPEWLNLIINLLVTLLVAIFLIRGKFKVTRLIWNFVSKNRLRFFGFGMLLLLADYGLRNLIWHSLARNESPGSWVMYAMYFFQLFWLIALITWLIPARHRPTSKPA